MRYLALFAVALLIPAIACNPVLAGAPSDMTMCTDKSNPVSQDRHASFADENLELLALRLSPGLRADETIYNRLVRDVSAIRRKNKKMESVHYLPPNDGRTILLVFDSRTLTRIQANQYDSWNCLNRYFGAVVTDSSSRLGFIQVRFHAPYNLEKVEELYGRLPGVKQVDPARMVGGGSTIYITRGERDWFYVFDIASGDCPAGCTDHELHYFRVSTKGTAREIATCTQECEPPPEWVKLYFRQYR